MTWLLLVIPIYGLICFYLGWRIWQWLRLFLPHWCGFVFWPLYVAVASSVFVERLLPMSGAGRIVGHIRNHWLGVFAYALMMILLIDLTRLVRHLYKRIYYKKGSVPRLSTSCGLLTGTVAVLLIAALGLYGSWNARQIRQVNLEIQISKSADVNSLKVILASDLHLGLVMDARRLQRFVTAVNDNEPDLILLAGDLFDSDYEALADPRAAWTELGRLQAKYGVYACLGNHDAGEDLGEMLRFLEKAGIQVLRDEMVQFAGIVVAGRLDISPIGDQGDRRPLDKLLVAVDRSRPIILLDHSPFGIADAKDTPVDLLVSGHAHNGQIFPGNLIVRAVYENGYGYWRFGDLQTVVTSGVGTWGPPWRIASQAEIVSMKINFDS
ncbi:MAG: metallophosphoesterase [Bacillota bacterium]|nr:metallophosphoesterase [Bacillota bacterium]